eukprot:Platyproteum_vivax@DN1157_c0_g1_i1.p1
MERPWTDRQFQKILQPAVKLLPEEIELLKQAGLWSGHKKKPQAPIEPRAKRTRGNKRDYAALIRGGDDAGELDSPKITRSISRTTPAKASSDNSEEGTSTSNALDEELSVEDRRPKATRQRLPGLKTK